MYQGYVINAGVVAHISDFSNVSFKDMVVRLKLSGAVSDKSLLVLRKRGGLNARTYTSIGLFAGMSDFNSLLAE